MTTSSMSSRALPIAVLVFSMVFFWVLVAFALTGGSLTDPAEILTRGAQATANADSFHLTLAVEGSMADPATGMDASLDGLTVEGSVDVAGDAAQLSFTLPMLFGMSGEAIVIGQDIYVMSAMLGDTWLHLPPSEDGESVPAEPPTDEEIADKVNELLSTDGIGIALLADQPCGEDTCYHIQMSISADAIAAYGDEMPPMGDEMGGLIPMPEFSGPAVVDLLFQQDGLWLRSVTMTSEGESGGASMSLLLSDYNTSFDISAPPPDQVTEADDFSLFP